LSFHPATQPGTCSSPTSKVPPLTGSKMRVAELVVERMQQFKRVAPDQLKHSTDCSLPKCDVLGMPPTAPRHDGALALALQQETQKESLESLEDAGLFFCQICQKDLSAMNSVRREQHVNRCLDEMEEAQMSSSSKPAVPECPICGKQFQTPQSRVSHLKRCAAEMDVPPKMLLQAVQMQVSTLGEIPLQFPSGSKRKVSSKEDSKNKQKRAKMETKDEDLLVAMAMSRSLLEQENCLFIWVLLPFLLKEKRRRRRGPTTPPPLLLQDPEKVRRRIEERVAMLLAQEVEFPPTPQLPTSRILEVESGKATWLLPLPKNKDCFLWNFSALTGPCDPESFYAAGLTPPIEPWKPVQVGHSFVLTVVCMDQTCDEFKSGPEGGDGQILSHSQKDIQNLQDLVELAKEGLTLTQWNLDVGHTHAAEQPSLRSLAEDFRAMVNNPHLSDVQFQVDSGEILYAHMFVLYARCPQAIQTVHSEGFLVEEDGNAQMHRVLLSDVTGEAARAFLRYLYAADADIPGEVLTLLLYPCRFGVRELMANCENNTGESQVSSGGDSECDLLSVTDDKDCEDRAENFQDLLKSMWVGEDEEEIAVLNQECQKEDDNAVGEQELEEIYEFAATQRRIIQGKTTPSEGTDCSMHSDTEAAPDMNQQTEEEEVKRSVSSSVSSNFKDLRDNNDVEISRCDLSAEKEGIQSMNRCRSMNATQITSVPHHREPQKRDVASHGATNDEGETTRRCEGEKDSRSSQVSHDVKGEDHCEKEFLSSAIDSNINDSYEHLFSATQGDYCEPSPTKVVSKVSEEGLGEKHADVDDFHLHSEIQEDLSPRKNGSYRSPPSKAFVPLFPAVGSSPLSPKSDRKLARESMSTPKQKKKSFPPGEILFQKANELETASPPDLPNTDLNKCVSVLSAPVIRTQDPAVQGRKKGDVIVLSSDDEMELEDKKSPESVTKTEQRSLQVSRVITDKVHVSNDVKMSTELPPSSHADACTEGEQSPNLSPEKMLSHEVSSGTDSSWLVPDTPVLTKSRSSSTQTHVTSINSSKSPESKVSTKSLAADSNDHETGRNVIEVHKATLSDKHLPVENCVSERNPSSGPETGSVFEKSAPLSSVDPVLALAHTSSKSKCANTSFLSKSVPPCHGKSMEDKSNVSVVEIQDSEGEKEISIVSLSSSVLLADEPAIPADDCWHTNYLTPVRANSQDSRQDGHSNTSAASSPKTDFVHDQWESPDQAWQIKGSTPLQGTPVGRRTTLLHLEKSPIEACTSRGSRPSYLNSKLWDEWDGEDEEDEFPEVLPLSQRVSAAAGADPIKTPGEKPACQENNNSPRTPVTPMPSYSMMETPQLKEELKRFGVRALPKRQMVLKLKEIFQYTHRDGDSDFEDEVPSSQPPQKSPAKRCRQSKAAQTTGGKHPKASKAVSKRKQVATGSSVLPVGRSEDDLVGPSKKGCAAPKERNEMIHHPKGDKEQKRSAASPEGWSLGADGEEPMLSASQKSTASSGDGSDISFSSQSSFVKELEAYAFASEEEEEELPASQAAAREEEKLEAVRCYIRSNPALYDRILFYEPIELADLHAELKLNGIKISKAKLLDFLDAQCITFTTAGARKEKEQKRKGSKKKRKRY
uniref:Structure-specific endonuclease subunit SLX4 n=1 Tax=Phasianus colchicus TaxID=9054 RepID=A0A669PMB2_PHACC